MTYEFEYLMHLFSCGSWGTTPQPPRQPVDFDRLIQLAQEHSVLPLVGIALGKARDTGLPSEKVKAIVLNTRNMALTNYVKRRLIHKLLQDFETAGIQTILLKGYVVADLYAEPDCRISCDTDIYISTKDEKQAYKLLRDQGCQVNPRSPISHHTVCEHPQMGHIELHVILYDKIVEDIWFDKRNELNFITEQYESCKTEMGSYLTLGKTDNLIFLTLHMVKHFILSGTSLRQIMDIALYINRYQSQIDIKRFWDTMESLKYRELINTVLSVMVSYCGFTSDNFRGFDEADELTISSLLTDLDAGGWLGSKESNKRKSAWHKYNRVKYTEKRSSLSYWIYVAKRKAISNILSIFPPISVLARKYPYARGKVWLSPVAWIHHLLIGLIKLLCGRLNSGIAVRENHISANINDRVYLFKLMKMI